MGTGICIGASAAALALFGLLGPAKACARTFPPAPAAAASAAERYGVAASDRSPTTGHGYSARARRMADCLATYPGYNPDTDRVMIRPGVNRRCNL